MPVRLSDVPLDLRLAGAAVACRRLDDPVLRLELTAAAHRPSERVYFLPAEAVERVLAANSGRHRKRRLEGTPVRA